MGSGKLALTYEKMILAYYHSVQPGGLDICAGDLCMSARPGVVGTGLPGRSIQFWRDSGRQ